MLLPIHKEALYIHGSPDQCLLVLWGTFSSVPHSVYPDSLGNAQKYWKQR